MRNEEVDEILDLYNQLSFNPRPSKKKLDENLPNNKHSNSEKLKKYQSYRKPSLPILPIQNSNGGDFRVCKSYKSRKSLFNFERSFSQTNLSETKFIYEDQFTDLNGNLAVPYRKKSSNLIESLNQKVDENNVYDTVLGITNANEADPSNAETHIYMEMTNPEIVDSLNNILSFTRQPKNSIEMVKTIKRKSDDTEKPFIEKPISEPNSTRTSDTSCRISDLKLTPISLNNVNISISDDQINNSESISDISDSLPLICEPNARGSGEYDNPTVADKSETVLLSSKIAENLNVQKSVQTEEEKVEFFKKVAKDINLQSYSVKEIIRFYLPNGAYSAQLIEISQTASSVCETLKKHFNIDPASCWQITEVVQCQLLERTLEDHEIILNVFNSWKNDVIFNKFIFQENPNKYQIFTKSKVFHKEMACDFDIDDNIWVKDVHSKWRRVSCFIYNSIVYFKLKPNSKDHKDLYSLVNLKNVNIYTCADNNKIKKLFKAPTSEIIIFRANNDEQKVQDGACICVLNPQQKERWLESLKVAKFSFDQLKQNYLDFEKKFKKFSRIQSYMSNSQSLNILTINSSSV